LKKPIPVTEGNQTLTARTCLHDQDVRAQATVAHLEIPGFLQTLYLRHQRSLREIKGLFITGLFFNHKKVKMFIPEVNGISDFLNNR